METIVECPRQVGGGRLIEGQEYSALSRKNNTNPSLITPCQSGALKWAEIRFNQSEHSIWRDFDQ